MKRVSVIIPTYNRIAFLPRAIKSILKQNYDNLEIIISDDGSTDNTEAFITEWQEKEPRLRYVKNRWNKGPAGARNTGIDEATGEYLAFLDSDNEWRENMLLPAIDFLENHSAVDVLLGNFEVIDFDTGEVKANFYQDKCPLLPTLVFEEKQPGFRIIRHPALGKIFLRDNFFHFSAAVIKKSLLGEMRINDEVFYYEDRDFAFRLAEVKNAVFAYRPEPVFSYFVHPTNMSQRSVYSIKFKRHSDFLHLLKTYEKKYKNHPYLEEEIKKLLLENYISGAALLRKAGRIARSIQYIGLSLNYGIKFRQLKEVVLLPLALKRKLKSIESADQSDYINN